MSLSRGLCTRGSLFPGAGCRPRSELQGLLCGRTSHGLSAVARSVDGPSGLLSPGTEGSTARVPGGPGPREAAAPADAVTGFPPARLSLRAAVFICHMSRSPSSVGSASQRHLPVCPFLCHASAPTSFGDSRLRSCPFPQAWLLPSAVLLEALVGPELPCPGPSTGGGHPGFRAHTVT